MVLVSGTVVLRLRSPRSGDRHHELCDAGTKVLIEPDDFVSYDLVGAGTTVIVLAEEPFQSRPTGQG